VRSLSDWLKTDPKNGCLIGPNGCHYENEHQAAHYALLGMCGCGWPVESFNFCQEALKAFDRRKALESNDPSEWIDAEAKVKELILDQPDMAAHVFAHMLSHLNLLEHGGNVGGSWLSHDGKRIVDMGPMTEELMEQDR
jgi:hypothetical protein